MSIFGMRRWPAPVLKPMWPFFAAGIVVMYGVNTIQDAVTGGGAKDDKAKKNAADH
ncbi:hypothetical protein E4U22_004081 [Claviceps purpurea]|uniref:Uncharacterized protein n=1 Tax=Claviceps purpurea (strain 20.1) TaxID=1111077 RepID=M1W6Z2_CLAP2|nr:hypothetical protein E4U12_006400 [Claviceps purpurea]CCE30785.1 uncharacterized protein CPUR_04634 [Claviceps purpurea 20.1]KAG6141376.1 hypothetical protein E4U38_006772 [Claviceps purpurea]KAG6147839.1 hypothetical protein E4U28_005951 [Claviceps purpurea]KAG6158381.1 hypothetical protein E4U37_005972 [Claviceps purpurea]